MNKLFTIFTYDPFPIISGLNSINIQDLNLFWRVVKDIQEKQQDFSVITVDNCLLDYSKQLIVLSDLISCPSPKTIFLKQILKRLKGSLSEDAIHQVYLLDRQIRNIFSKEIFASGLPLDVSEKWSLDDIIKSMDVSYNLDQNNSPIEVISEFIDLSFSLEDHRIILLTNLSQYLTKNERIQVAYDCESKNVTILSINLSSEGIENADSHENVCFIDRDFVQFTNH